MRYLKLKNELKQLAKEIREWKNNRKYVKRRDLGMVLWKVQDEIGKRKYEFRHKHIAYCMLRGREYNQIENKCKELPNFDLVDSIKTEYESKVIRVGA